MRRLLVLATLAAALAGMAVAAPAAQAPLAPASPVDSARSPTQSWRAERIAFLRTLRPRDGVTYLVALRPGKPMWARSGGLRRRLRPRTEFGSPRVLSITAVRGRRLGVIDPEFPNGRTAWIDGLRPDLDFQRTSIALRADLSSRTLEIRRDGRVIHRMAIGVGRPGAETPTGRFAVTDRIRGSSYGGKYGCCVIALSGHQPRLPADWPGGDRLAIHGTRDESSVGRAASTGCFRAREADLRELERLVPLGTPVEIRR